MGNVAGAAGRPWVAWLPMMMWTSNSDRTLACGRSFSAEAQSQLETWYAAARPAHGECSRRGLPC